MVLGLPPDNGLRGDGLLKFQELLGRESPRRCLHELIPRLLGMERSGATWQYDAGSAFDHTKIKNTSVQTRSKKRFKLLDGDAFMFLEPPDAG